MAVSTGRQISSRLLSMRSANALLELPRVSGSLPAGTLVSALLIADVADMPMSQTPILLCQPSASTPPSGTPPPPPHSHPHSHSHSERKSERESGVGEGVGGGEAFVKVAVLTVSDTVAEGRGPDRR